MILVTTIDPIQSLLDTAPIEHCQTEVFLDFLEALQYFSFRLPMQLLIFSFLILGLIPTPGLTGRLLEFSSIQELVTGS